MRIENLEDRFKNLLAQVKSEAPFQADIALILGSGLGDFANSIKIVKSISTSEVHDYPQSTVNGHSGKILFCEHANKKVLLFQGRIHFYEGYNLAECLVPVLITKYLHTSRLLLTNAAGGINSNFNAGDLMLITSFNSIAIKKEFTSLIGLASVEMKNNMLKLPHPNMIKIIKKSAANSNIKLREGIYFFTKGPSYETPAEIQMMKIFGADAVGMSTAHEAVFAAINGIEAGAISLITNLAAGISKVKLSHQEVIETADRVKHDFERLIKRIIESL